MDTYLYILLQKNSYGYGAVWKAYLYIDLQVNGMPITVAVGNIVSEEGFSFLMSPVTAEAVWKAFLDQGAIPMSLHAWETLRILQGSLL